ncbi:MAG: hypothetical protein DRQ35_01790 [Gammaproteobacteria bacterium]|nr:MAG: hypothetical protein DRQ35_01790 [Gammaproteobacteria bacterium]
MADCTEFEDVVIPPVGLPTIPDGMTTDVVTDGCVDGKGIYDNFMQAHLDAIHQEYAKQRIKGSEYSKVYLGGMQAAMQNAVGFALGKDEAAAKAELARYAIVKSAYDIELVKAQVCLVNAQIDEMRGKAKLVEIQCWTELSKIHSTPVQVAAVPDVEALRAKGITDVPDITGVFETQMLKTGAEESLLTQKEITEHSQTNNGTAASPSVPYTGQALKQRNLLQRQADGFVRDAEAKAAKIIADAHSIEFSTLDGEGTGLSIEGSVTQAEAAFSNAGNVHSPALDLPTTDP